MRARALMLLGTASHVGKSLLTAGLCRVLAEEGIRVAPFKAQNMSLNSAATIEGLEIGRAQALQAEAAGVAASVHMNPVLLKPTGDMRSQVVVRGRIWGQLSAADYHQRRVRELLPLVAESYETLAAGHDVIVLEGAGSPAEINLKENDIVNMRMAELAEAACVLVGDIDRGGVFASLLGTVELLEAAERARIRGFLINKFRGDVSLLKPGIVMMEERLRTPCVGVVPWMPGLALEEEDSVSLDAAGVDRTVWAPSSSAARALRIAVVALPSLANFTDFDALLAEPSIELAITRRPDLLKTADLLILPGSKQTAEDLAWLRAQDLEAIVAEHARHGLVLGICGGLQMLGESICDPAGMEAAGEARGLGWLPVRTTMQTVKTTQRVRGTTASAKLFAQDVPPMPVAGYEIHVGQSGAGTAAPFARVQTSDGGETFADGCVSDDGRVVGTYLHGVFDEDVFRHACLAAARSFHGLAPAASLTCWKQKREESFAQLSRTMRASMNMATIFQWIGLPYRGGAR